MPLLSLVLWPSALLSGTTSSKWLEKRRFSAPTVEPSSPSSQPLSLAPRPCRVIWSHARRSPAWTLEAGQQKLTFAKVTHHDKLRLHTLLEKWIIRDQQSLSVLDHPDFRVLIHGLLAGYEPPTRNIMTRKIGVNFKVLKSQVKAELQAIPGRDTSR
ncbi:hypothetical protein CF327_g2430 [Tilletia walkeri]|nr:hypothetical protein CF327_g2430 [Tilletia walkeri]